MSAFKGSGGSALGLNKAFGAGSMLSKKGGGGESQMSGYADSAFMESQLKDF